MVQKIKITFLGTSSAVPTKNRNHQAVLLTYNDENILFDCGEGTQRQFRLANLNPCKITKILITHWHGDHILGIPGLLQTLAFSGYNKKLEIYGPSGTKRFMSEILKTFVFTGKIFIDVKEVEGKFFETDDFSLEAEKMIHGTPCNAYSFLLKERRRVDKQKLKKAKIPEGPLLQNLKLGKNISHNGKVFNFNDLTFLEAQKKISFVMDTSENDRIIPFVKNSDLLIMEATFDKDMDDVSLERHHLTSEQSAKIAKKANAKKLILTHLSQKHDVCSKKILDESKKIFKNSFVAKDFDVVDI